MNSSFDSFIETEVPQNELIISRTNLEGIITHANETFADISGYSVDELVGQPHNIVRHPDMPASIFRELWQTLRSGQSWQGYVKNLRADGGYYWVHAIVSGVYKDGELVEYKSLRAPVDNETKIRMQREYDARREAEEDRTRVVLYLSRDEIEKVENLLNKGTI